MKILWYLSLIFGIGYLGRLQPCLAQWSNDPAQNLQILSNSIAPKAVTDGAGGVIVVGGSFTQNPILYAQRVDKYGNIVWDPTLRGIRVTTAGDEQSEHIVVSDNKGGAYVGFNALTIIGRRQEPPEPIYTSRVKIQRFDANGNLFFGAQGIALYDYPIDSTEGGQDLYALVPADSGGVYVIWGDPRGPQGNNIYVNHVDPNGQVSWKNSIALNIRFSIKKDLLPYADGEGGIIIYYKYEGTLLDHRFIRIHPNGDVFLDKPIDTGLTPFYLFSTVAGECILFWQDFNQFMQLDTIRCQRIGRDGEKLWGENPVIIDSTGLIANPRLIGMINDQSGGAFVAYGKEDRKTQLLRIDRNGVIVFKKLITNFNAETFSGQDCMVPAPNNGVLYSTFIPQEFGYACAVDSLGRELWPMLTYSTRKQDNSFDVVVSDRSNGAIFAWYEILPLRGIWAQQVNARGQLGVVTSVKDLADQKFSPKTFRLFPAYPNPFGGVVRIAYQLPEAGMAKIKVYDLSGREMITLTDRRHMAGSYEIVWDGRDQYGHPVSS